MSYHHGQHRLNEFVPHYVPHSDYLPHNQVIDGRQHEVQGLLSQYELERSRGHVYTQRPAEFDPRRYVSVRTYEDVKVGQPVSEEHIRHLLNRQPQYRY